MIESGVIILKQTYKPNEIIPFPISMNVINSFQQAILMPLPTNHFYMYLEDLHNYEEALIIFGLHADISIYNRMVEEIDDGNYETCKQKAIEIFEDYITEDCNYRVDQTAESRMSYIMDNEMLQQSVNQDMSIKSDNKEALMKSTQRTSFYPPSSRKDITPS